MVKCKDCEYWIGIDDLRVVGGGYYCEKIDAKIDYCYLYNERNCYDFKNRENANKFVEKSKQSLRNLEHLLKRRKKYMEPCKHKGKIGFVRYMSSCSCNKEKDNRFLMQTRE